MTAMLFVPGAAAGRMGRVWYYVSRRVSPLWLLQNSALDSHANSGGARLLFLHSFLFCTMRHLQCIPAQPTICKLVCC